MADGVVELEVPEEWVHEIVRRSILKIAKDIQYMSVSNPEIIKEEEIEMVIEATEVIEIEEIERVTEVIEVTEEAEAKNIVIFPQEKIIISEE